MGIGTIYGTTSNQYIESAIDWTSTPSTANNSSTVTASLYYRRTNTYSGTPTGGTGTFTITINGQSQSVTASFEVPNNGSWVHACSVTKTVAHNADGKKSITISASGGLPPSSLSATYCSGTVTLDNIPRQATLTSAPDFTDEQNPTINYSNPAGGAVTALEACISLTTETDDIAYRAIPTGGTSYTFNLTDAERAILRNATQTSNSRTVYFYVRTNINGTLYHSSIAKTMTIVNANPIYSSDRISYADTNAAVVKITGNNQHIVQNKSSLTVTVGAVTTINKGAWISQYSVTVNGVTQTAPVSGNFAFGAVNTSQNTNISVAVTDSRGNKTTVTKQITIVPYSVPVVNATLARLNNYEDETYLTPSVSIASLNGKNTLSVSYKMKQNGGSYGSSVALTNNTKHTTSCLKDYAYIFAVTATDIFGSVTREFLLDVGKFPMFIDTEKNAVGINAFPTQGQALRVADGIGYFEDGICSNGVFIKSVGVSNSTTFTMATKFGQFDSSGVSRQTIFVFGACNDVFVQGTVKVYSNGVCDWYGTSGTTVESIGGNAEIRVNLPKTAWDRFTLISSDVFYV